MLLTAFLDLLQSWRSVFPQQRSFERAVQHAVGAMACLGRRCLSRIIWTNGGQQRSWSSHYFLYSRCHWDPQKLFVPLLAKGLTYCPDRLVGIAVDDTHKPKTGRCIRQASYYYDPLSPPFWPNLKYGLRFLQASLLLPLHRQASVPARAIPICFEEVSVVKKPGKRADEASQQRYRQERKRNNLSTRFVVTMKILLTCWEEAGGQGKIPVLVADASFCNRTVWAGLPPGMEMIARVRKDAVLCRPAPQGSRRFYDQEKFSPEDIRQRQDLPWKTARLFYGGTYRRLRYKELSPVLWQGGARKRPLRLLVLAPTPYRKRNSGRFYYRQPGFLLTSILHGDTRRLLQMYLDRWQIEINHREEKDTLGVGQAQLWNPISVPKQPALVVATYSALLLASLQAFGAQRGAAYAELPKWRRKAKRPSCLDLITLLRKEMVQNPEKLEKLKLHHTDSDLTGAAAA